MRALSVWSIITMIIMSFSTVLIFESAKADGVVQGEIVHQWGTTTQQIKSGARAFINRHPFVDVAVSITWEICKANNERHRPYETCCPKGETCASRGTYITKEMSIPDFGASTSVKSCLKTARSNYLNCVEVIRPSEGMKELNKCAAQFIALDVEGKVTSLMASVNRSDLSCCGADRRQEQTVIDDNGYRWKKGVHTFTAQDEALCDWSRRTWAGLNLPELAQGIPAAEYVNLGKVGDRQEYADSKLGE